MLFNALYVCAILSIWGILLLLVSTHSYISFLCMCFEKAINEYAVVKCDFSLAIQGIEKILYYVKAFDYVLQNLVCL